MTGTFSLADRDSGSAPASIRLEGGFPRSRCSDEDEAVALARSSQRFLARERREFEGDRLQYQMFEI